MGIHHRHLPSGALSILARQLFDHSSGLQTGFQMTQSIGPIGHVGIALSGNGAYPCLGPWHHGAHAKEFALNSDTQFLGQRIKGNDGKSGDQRILPDRFSRPFIRKHPHQG